MPLSGLLFLVPAVLLVLLDGGPDAMWWAVGVVAVYAVIQTLEMAVLTPLIMGREVELHPVTLILALLLCGKLLGVIGLILAVPIAATVRILARQFLLPWLRRQADGGEPLVDRRSAGAFGGCGEDVPRARAENGEGR